VRRLWISAAVIAADQVSKAMVTSRMDLGESVPVLGSFFKLTYILNPGAVFGLKLGGQALHLLFAIIALGLVATLLYRTPASERAGSIGLALVLGGAVGNVIDRLAIGAVVDFLDFGTNGYRWWVFNIADASVTTGAALLVLSYAILNRPEDRKDGAEDAPEPEAGDAVGDRSNE